MKIPAESGADNEASFLRRLSRVAWLTRRLNDPRARRRLIVATSLLLITAALLLSTATRLTPLVRQRVIRALGDRFDAQIELRAFQLSIFPRPAIAGEGLVVRHRGRTDVPPLITIESFSAGAGLLGLLRRPLRLHSVALDGLVIRLPPSRRDDERADGQRSGDPPAPDRPASAPGESPQDAPLDVAASLVVGRITSTDARLEIASSKPGKLPRVFQIHRLVLDEFGLDRPSSFVAALTNPKPEGLIETRGRFGPWHRTEPRHTPIDGTYTFSGANLDTIKGIGGTLSSQGRFSGILERLDVEGDTDTPDFSVDVAGQPVHLKTRFKAVVDGTSGDTWLKPVDASVLESTIRATGAVVRATEEKGRLISLDVSVDKGRIEDLLKLAIKSKTPPLVGAVTLTTSLEIPPGDRDVVEKLRLDGRFALARARFTNFDIQQKIDALSRRGRGEAGETRGESVASDMKARFRLRDGVLSFSELTFAVPGALVRLTGRYSLPAETLAFKGELLIDAPLSETTSGWKAALARLAQPFFKREGGGSRIPIKVEGTRERPEFGLDIGRVVKPGD
jgi:hypothetical protein